MEFSKGGYLDEGWVIDNKLNGKGRHIWKSGNYYIGQFKNGQKNGHGEYYDLNGDKYTGMWLNHNRHGYGKLFYYNL